MEIADLAQKREDIEQNIIVETYYSILAHYLPKASKMYSILAPFITRISENSQLSGSTLFELQMSKNDSYMIITNLLKLGLCVFTQNVL